MKVHEYQANEIFKKYNVKIPESYPAFSVKEAVESYQKLGCKTVVIKAQIHAGGRGKAGGIKLVNTNEDLIKEATSMFGKTLITKQETGLYLPSLVQLIL